MLPTEHREKAISLLEAATAHAMTSPVRATILAEAQVHATLSLAPAPVGIVFPDVPGGLTLLDDEPACDHLPPPAGTPVLTAQPAPSTPSPKPAPKKRPARPRKPASPKETS